MFVFCNMRRLTIKLQNKKHTNDHNNPTGHHGYILTPFLFLKRPNHAVFARLCSVKDGMTNCKMKLLIYKTGRDIEGWYDKVADLRLDHDSYFAWHEWFIAPLSFLAPAYLMVEDILRT